MAYLGTLSHVYARSCRCLLAQPPNHPIVRLYTDMRRDMHPPLSEFATHLGKPVRNMNGWQKPS